MKHLFPLSLICALVATLGACSTATTPPADAAATTQAPAMVCEQERSLGSNIAHSRCRTAADAQHERDASARIMDGMSRSPNPGMSRPAN
ncbi:hypothetical protein F7Q92_17725 [Ideonella dechloratans]|uniref:Lipoprotein n=1 Tax=Ideonella dechloratans TaxID=36863 RepID=A0A643F859_IDEDE|nr:hypothetical protein [Ideonella dechloratans]KAB0576608.1 hypothetical protein F7Q92_17725 [Ideonella dechloratans]UFU10176.1 hypothetical protein LRM40_00190 [Ideonella dechloratans]